MIAAAVSVLLGEPFTKLLVLGGLLVVGAMLLSELWGGSGDTPPPAAATPRS